MTDQPTLKPYAVEVSVLAGRDEAWIAVTQPPVLHRWFGWDYDGLDAEIRQIFVDEATLLAPERMGWADGSYLEVQGDDDTSVVRAVREGDPPADPDAYDAIEEGWRAFLVQLTFLLEQRPPGRRRTLYLTGETTGRQVLAMVDGEWRRAGSRVAWVAAPGGSLVVAAARAPLDSPDATGMQIVVSTYGLDDAAFDTVRDEWSKRWTAVADGAQVTSGGTPGPG
ncbi:MAG TPA: activator of HSP90 ATPase [Actinoplanes sp.]|nr:activator of HSP90 ATPase [Actinoplanes sp.]